MSEKILFIGGSMDGRREVVLEIREIWIPVRIQGEAEYGKEVYVKRGINGVGKIFYVRVLQSMTHEETIEKLLKGYKP